MDDNQIQLAVIVIIILFCTYKLFFEHKVKLETLNTKKEDKATKQYLKYRLDAVRRELDYTEGYMQALSGVSRVEPVLDKIQELDEQYEKLKKEEFKLMTLF